MATVVTRRFGLKDNWKSQKSKWNHDFNSKHTQSFSCQTLRHIGQSNFFISNQCEIHSKQNSHRWSQLINGISTDLFSKQIQQVFVPFWFNDVNETVVFIAQHVNELTFVEWSIRRICQSNDWPFIFFVLFFSFFSVDRRSTQLMAFLRAYVYVYVYVYEGKKKCMSRRTILVSFFSNK